MSQDDHDSMVTSSLSLFGSEGESSCKWHNIIDPHYPGEPHRLHARTCCRRSATAVASHVHKGAAMRSSIRRVRGAHSQASPCGSDLTPVCQVET
eukprot:3801558-Rhodomonas_salina.2